MTTDPTDPLITIEWPETNLGDTASVPCPCAEFAGSLAGRAYHYCGGTFSHGAHWEALDISHCALNENTTRRLCKAALLLAKVLLIWPCKCFTAMGGVPYIRLKQGVGQHLRLQYYALLSAQSSAQSV